MPSSSNAGPSSAKSEDDCMRMFAQEMGSLRDKDLPQDQSGGSPAGGRPAGGSYLNSRGSASRGSGTDAMIVKNIRAAMKDLKPKP
ncbi:hypothetical protein HJFPF1_05589 [Paramyrothecium foliicola]|nr:hypothetical protein HJFPF1_05589 [Paramyrothecium foliicola]